MTLTNKSSKEISILEQLEHDSRIAQIRVLPENVLLYEVLLIMGYSVNEKKYSVDHSDYGDLKFSVCHWSYGSNMRLQYTEAEWLKINKGVEDPVLPSANADIVGTLRELSLFFTSGLIEKVSY